METITRIELTKALSKNLKILFPDSKNIVDDIFELMIEGMKQDGKILLSNFGLFDVLNKSKRIGRNPKLENSPTYPISARKSIKFKACRTLKETIDKTYKEQFKD